MTTTMPWARGPLLALAAIGLTAIPLHAQSATPDEDGVRRAALDYLEGFYEGSDDKIRRSVSPEVVKVGYARRGAGGDYQRVPMSYDEMFEFTAGVRAGQGVPPADAPKEVEILDIRDQTAVVRVVAWWGQDYLQMARIDGRWMILHVLWQTLG